MDWLFANWLVVLLAVIAVTAIAIARIAIGSAVSFANFGLGLIIAFTGGDDRIAKKALEHSGLGLVSWLLIIMSAAGWFILAAMSFIQLANWVAGIYPT